MCETPSLGARRIDLKPSVKAETPTLLVAVDGVTWQRWTGPYCFSHARTTDDPRLCGFVRWNPLHKEFFCGMYDSLPLKTAAVTVEVVPFGPHSIDVPCRCDVCVEARPWSKEPK